MEPITEYGSYQIYIWKRRWHVNHRWAVLKDGKEVASAKSRFEGPGQALKDAREFINTLAR